VSEPLNELEPALAESAEEVRAFLVSIRGGAPFLSGADGRLLVDWLGEGVSVAAILAAIEAAAARRAKRHARTRLSLSACQGELRRRITQRAAPPLPAARPEGELRAWPTLASLAHEIAASKVDPALEAARERLVLSLSRLATGLSVDGAALEGASEELVARQAIAACRVFQDAAWRAAEPRRVAMLGEAEAELATLRGVIPDEAFAAAVEELARDRLRAATPLVSAVVVWDRIAGG